MGIYDRDWYKDKYKGKATDSASRPSPSRKPSDSPNQFTTNEPIVKRVAVRRSTYERWLDSQKRHPFPTWLIVFGWTFLALLIFAVIREFVR